VLLIGAAHIPRAIMVVERWIASRYCGENSDLPRPDFSLDILLTTYGSTKRHNVLHYYCNQREVKHGLSF